MNHLTTRKTFITRRVLAGAAVLALTAPLGIAWSATKNATVLPESMAGNIPVHGKRVVLVLPLQTGQGWTANPVFTQNLKQRASTVLRDAFLNTGQFSLIEVNRFNPVLQRGITDELYSQEDFDAVLADPTPDSARTLLSKLTFDRGPKLQFTQAPLILQLTLDTYPTDPKRAAVQVTGTMYEIGEDENTVCRTKIATAALTTTIASTPVATSTRRKKNQKSIAPVVYRTSDLLLSALNSAFTQVAADFARPLQAAEAPFLAAPAGATLPVAPTPAAPAPVNPSATPVPLPTEVPQAPAETEPQTETENDE